MTIIRIGDKSYDAIDMQDLSLRHTLALQRELAVTNISSARTWAEVQALVREFAGLSQEERVLHPESVFLTAVTVWAARVSAGEDVGLLEAVDVPLRSIQFISQPSDRKPPQGKAGAGRKGSARKTS